MEYNKTPIIELRNGITEEAGISLGLKREDLNHPFVSGNKWWKLKNNIEEAQKNGHHTLLTLGGAYSNHLFATAAAAKELGLHSIGIVRGEETFPLNSTLTFVKNQGMQLHYVSRADYRRKHDDEFIESLHKYFGDFYLIPEGGTNELAVKGTTEWGNLLKREMDFDYLCLPVGTGGTIAGLINAMPEKEIIGFSSLKGGSFLSDDIKKWVSGEANHWRIETSYHFGGYGKTNRELMEFIDQFESDHSIPLDPVYTGKMMFGIYALIKEKVFPSGARVLALHTGGLQGRFL